MRRKKPHNTPTKRGSKQKSEPTKKAVFIVHGHDEYTKKTVSDFIENLGLTPIILSEQPDLGKTIIEKVEYYLDRASFAVILLTGDDIGGEAYVQCDISQCGGMISQADIIKEKGFTDRFKENLEGPIERYDCYTSFEFAAEILRRTNLRSRQNVIFELGITIGYLGRDNVRVLYEEGVELPSDIHGLVHIPLNAGWKKKLLQELIAVGILDEKSRMKLLEIPIKYTVKMGDIPEIQLKVSDFLEGGWEAQTTKRADTQDSDWQYWDTFTNMKNSLRLDALIHRYQTIGDAQSGFSQNKSEFAKTQVDGRLFAPDIGEESYGYISTAHVEVATFRTANLLVTTCFYLADNLGSIRHAERFGQIIDGKIRKMVCKNYLD